MVLLDGKQLARQIKEELAQETAAIIEAGGKVPHLAAVLVGDNPASQVYVRNKVRSCERVGFHSTLIRKSADVSEDELLHIIEELNQDPGIDGFIVQLPLPDHLDEDKITLAIDPSKDVDGFHPVNMGRMALGLPCYLPATPCGIIQMLERYEIPTSGKQVVVVGRSNIVGTPISILLSRKAKVGNATVTLCHSRTANLADHTRRADIIIASVGRPNTIKADMVKRGAVVIDVGINRVDDPEAAKGYRLVGDVDFEGVSKIASHITPVPGGVGQMTVVSLLMNTLSASKREIYG
ncbi:MAG: bifunctional methylenetetrahydrofolate dehydrogenase/methenyltetrahydrofolate cyclohydrolase FolD [Bacteroidota bacterium]